MNLQSQINCDEIVGRFAIHVDANNSKRIPIYKVQIMRKHNDARNVRWYAGVTLTRDRCTGHWLITLTEDFKTYGAARDAALKWKEAGFADVFIDTAYRYILDEPTVDTTATPPVATNDSIPVPASETPVLNDSTLAVVDETRMPVLVDFESDEFKE